MKELALTEYQVRQLVDLITWALNKNYFDDHLSELRTSLLKQAELEMNPLGRMT